MAKATWILALLLVAWIALMLATTPGFPEVVIALVLIVAIVALLIARAVVSIKNRRQRSGQPVSL